MTTVTISDRVSEINGPPSKFGRRASPIVATTDRSHRDAGIPSRENRKMLSEDYEAPISGREDWWRKDIRDKQFIHVTDKSMFKTEETPIPGSYDVSTFLEEIDKRPNTYRFRSDGRKVDPQPHGKGSLLLPGAYQHHDFLYSLRKARTTYSFKSTGRNGRDYLNFGRKDKTKLNGLNNRTISDAEAVVDAIISMKESSFSFATPIVSQAPPTLHPCWDQSIPEHPINFQDTIQDVNVSPMAYEVEKYLSLTVDKQPSRHWVFRSQSNRLTPGLFKPKDGPGPGNYEYAPPIGMHIVTSSFKSRTPRFSTSHTRVPGPGTYEKTYQCPIPSTISTMGRSHGLFYASAFQA